MTQQAKDPQAGNLAALGSPFERGGEKRSEPCRILQKTQPVIPCDELYRSFSGYKEDYS
jgi:hypothetical protein